MVRQVGKIVCMVALISALLCAPVRAATHSIYDSGNLSTTYVTYFEDIVSGIGFNENYVAFRSDQYTYILIVGELEYNNGSITLVGDTAKEYKYYAEITSGYNSQYRYSVDTLNDFSLDTGNYIIYSDVGDYPQLIERGAKIESITAIILCIFIVMYIVRNIFRHR